jgi:hypothetical protein
MDAFTPGALPGQAQLRYLDADFEVVRPGRFVLIAVTGRKNPQEDQRNMDVEAQEAYFDAEAALARWKQITGRP